MKNRRFFKSLICFLVITALCSITVFAKYFTSSDSIANKFSVGDIKTGIAENFNPDTTWNGREISKNVKIKNTGKNEELIRVSIIPRWIDESGNTWLGDTDFVKLNLNNENIVENPDAIIGEDKWIDGKDGYYYYSNVLKTGTNEDIKKEAENEISPSERYKESLSTKSENYTSELLKSVSLDLSKLTDTEKAKFEGKRLIVDVNVEAIEPRKGEISKQWKSIPKEVENKLNAYLNQYLDSKKAEN